MSKKGGSAPPPAPDPVALTQAQATANQQTAAANQKLGMTSAYGPGGAVRYETDPNSPSGYRQVTDLSPDQQAIFDAQNRAQTGALDVANQQIGRVNTALGQTLTPPDMQTGFGTSPIASSFNPGGFVRSGFSSGPPLRTS